MYIRQYSRIHKLDYISSVVQRLVVLVLSSLVLVVAALYYCDLSSDSIKDFN